jgi:hypothetical protein
MMDKRTEGAWIIHHTKKIKEFNDANAFEDIELAGKCGLLLSSLAASDEESELSKDKIEAIRQNLEIKKLEFDSIKKILIDEKLIDTSSSGDIVVMGITTSNVLTHTTNIFSNSTDDTFQKASIDLANCISDTPKNENSLKEYISDTHKLDTKILDKLFTLSEDIGLIDYDYLEKKDKVYFNGNLFRKEHIDKTSKILSALKEEEIKKVNEVNKILDDEGCISLELAQRLLGTSLLDKLKSIAMFDFNEVSNNIHSQIFITKPSSFSKFGSPFEDDALDMAKAFIASLYYGMKVSSFGRGQIQDRNMLINTLNKLLRGAKVGPCTAIGQDYLVLEMNRVIQLEHSNKDMYFMRLLKYDVARLALEVLKKGDLAEQILPDNKLQSSNVSLYSGPEKNRFKTRAKKDTTYKSNISDLIRTMRS